MYIAGVPLLRLAITWDAGEPDNYKNSERCLAMFVGDESSAGGTMSDTSCDRVLPYVCYENDTILKMTECGTTDESGYSLGFSLVLAWYK